MGCQGWEAEKAEEAGKPLTYSLVSLQVRSGFTVATTSVGFGLVGLGLPVVKVIEAKYSKQ